MERYVRVLARLSESRALECRIRRRGPASALVLGRQRLQERTAGGSLVVTG